MGCFGFPTCFLHMDQPFKYVMLFGDWLFILSYCLYFRLVCRGTLMAISLRTLEIYLLTFCMRYVDLLWNFNSFYLYTAKILLLALSSAAVVAYRCSKAGREARAAGVDWSARFCVLVFVVPCAALGSIINAASTPFKILWAASRYLEAVAILPQLSVLRKRGVVDSLTADYVVLLGLWRVFYVLGYVLSWNRTSLISFVPGVVQSILHLELIVVYVRAKRRGCQRGIHLGSMHAEVGTSLVIASMPDGSVVPQSDSASDDTDPASDDEAPGSGIAEIRLVQPGARM